MRPPPREVAIAAGLFDHGAWPPRHRVAGIAAPQDHRYALAGLAQGLTGKRLRDGLHQFANLFRRPVQSDV